MEKITLTYTKEEIEAAVLKDESLYVFSPPHTVGVDEITFNRWVGKWKLLIKLSGGQYHLVAKPTNLGTGKIFREGKVYAICRDFPNVSRADVEKYVELARGKKHPWDKKVQAYYFNTLLGLGVEDIDLPRNQVGEVTRMIEESKV